MDAVTGSAMILAPIVKILRSYRSLRWLVCKHMVLCGNYTLHMLVPSMIAVCSTCQYLYIAYIRACTFHMYHGNFCKSSCFCTGLANRAPMFVLVMAMVRSKCHNPSHLQYLIGSWTLTHARHGCMHSFLPKPGLGVV